MAVFLFAPTMLRCMSLLWHKADNPAAPAFVGYWTNNDGDAQHQTAATA